MVGRAGSQIWTLSGRHTDGTCGRTSTISQSKKKPRSVTAASMAPRTKLLAPSQPTTNDASIRCSAPPAPRTSSLATASLAYTPATSRPRCTSTVARLRARSSSSRSSSGWGNMLPSGQPDSPVGSVAKRSNVVPAAFRHS